MCRDSAVEYLLTRAPCADCLSTPAFVQSACGRERLVRTRRRREARSRGGLEQPQLLGDSRDRRGLRAHGLNDAWKLASHDLDDGRGVLPVVLVDGSVDAATGVKVHARLLGQLHVALVLVALVVLRAGIAEGC
jgi:hypothetical protein